MCAVLAAALYFGPAKAGAGTNTLLNNIIKPHFPHKPLFGALRDTVVPLKDGAVWMDCSWLSNTNKLQWSLQADTH